MWHRTLKLRKVYDTLGKARPGAFEGLPIDICVNNPYSCLVRCTKKCFLENVNRYLLYLSLIFGIFIKTRKMVKLGIFIHISSVFFFLNYNNSEYFPRLLTRCHNYATPKVFSWFFVKSSISNIYLHMTTLFWEWIKECILI